MSRTAGPPPGTRQPGAKEAVRGDLHVGTLLTIADGYHRICASYLLDEGADIPCRLAKLPRSDETLAGGPLCVSLQ